MPKRSKFALAEPEAVAQAIGHRFAKPELLRAALTHPSLDPASEMERLEFLGDAVLGAVVASLLVSLRPDLDEGAMTALKAWLVRRERLVEVAAGWHVHEAVRVGPGERTPDGRLRSPSIAADAAEAVIGAVFLDAGWEAAQALIARTWAPMVEQADPKAVLDPKTRLQELTQAKGWGLPEYRVEDHGAEAGLRFHAECWVQGEKQGEGWGARKKDAERAAAREALARLGEDA